MKMKMTSTTWYLQTQHLRSLILWKRLRRKANRVVVNLEPVRSFVFNEAIVKEDHRPIKQELIPQVLLQIIENALLTSPQWKCVHEGTVYFDWCKLTRFFDRSILENLYWDTLIEINKEIESITGLDQLKYTRHYEFLSDRILLVHLNKSEIPTSLEPMEEDDE